MNEPTPDDFQRLGIYDPGSPDAIERLEVLNYLVELGATEEQLVEAITVRGAAGVAVELVLRPPGLRMTLAEAAEVADLSVDELSRFIRALGFPDPSEVLHPVSERSVEQIRIVLAGGKQLLGDEAALALARVMGSTMFRLAQAVGATFRANFEAPQLRGGYPYVEVVRQYAQLTKNLIPAFFDALENIFADHLIAIASGTWSLDEEGGAPRQSLLVGFIDMVGYSALSRDVSSSRLVDVLGRFEDAATEITTRHNGHVVKMVGDGAMFIADGPVEGCRAALELVDRFAGQDDLPPVHIGLATGPLITLNGDFFGDAVNVAARLHELAPPSKVLVDRNVADAVRDHFNVEDVSVWLAGSDVHGPIYELSPAP